MKKSLVAVLLVVFACLICMSACEDTTEEMTAEKWEETLGNPISNTNVTIKTTYVLDNKTETAIANLDLSRKKFYVSSKSDGYLFAEYYSIENDEFYNYAKNDDGKWEKYHLDKVENDPLGAVSLVDALKNSLDYYWIYYPEFKKEFKSFTFDEQMQQYVAENLQIHASGVSLTYKKVAYKFDDSLKPLYVEIQFDETEKLTIEFSDYNATKVSLPKDCIVID